MPTQVTCILRLKHTHSISFCTSLQYGRSALLNGHSSALLRTDFFGPMQRYQTLSIVTRFGYNNLKQNHKFQGKMDERPLTATSLQRPFFLADSPYIQSCFLFIYVFLIIVLFKSHC